MVKTKTTVTAADHKTYVSLDIETPEPDHAPNSYSFQHVNVAIGNKGNFPAFNGTDLEWEAILATALLVKTENLGKV